MKQYSKIRLYLAIAAISFLQGLQFSVSPVLGKIQAHYPDVNVSLVQMLITAPGLFSLVVSLVSGWLVLKITKKKLLIFAGFVAGVTGLLPFLHDSFPLLLVSRTVYGISLGIATTMNMAVVAEFFEGNERVKAMGIQAASVGAGMVVTTVCAGFLGRGDFRNSYFINLIGFISMIVLIICLPETGVAKETKTEKIRLNGKVLIMDLFALLENVFLITYTLFVLALIIHVSLDGFLKNRVFICMLLPLLVTDFMLLPKTTGLKRQWGIGVAMVVLSCWYGYQTYTECQTAG
jgi:MFS family permease